MQSYVEYADFIKPAWAPPAFVFGPVWTILYILIGVSFGYVFYRFARGRIDGTIALPFALNIIFNILFTPLLFWFGSFWLATVDILLVLGTLVWAMVAIWSKHRWVVYSNMPYLAWVMFATVLQLAVTLLNT